MSDNMDMPQEWDEEPVTEKSRPLFKSSRESSAGVMTIQDAIRMLERLRDEHGPTTRVYFDCPHCQQSFMPDMIEAKREIRLLVPGRKS